MMKYLLKLKLHYNFIFLFILISSVKVEEISIEPDYEKIGETSTKYLNKNKEIELYFKGDIKNQILLVHFFPIDCEIKIETINPEQNKKNKIIIKKIHNYNYDSFFVLFKNSSSFRISPLKLSQKEQNQNRNYHLIINTIKIGNSTIPKLP